MSFDILSGLIEKKNNPTVMGLDPKLSYVPEFLREGKSVEDALFEFNKMLIDCTAELIPAVKPQSAFYEMYGLEGLRALDRTIRYAKEAGLYVILDVKRGDIGSTAEAYAEAFFGKDSAGSDCVTVNPYLGIDGVAPFINKAAQMNKSLFILVKTSNPSSKDFQDLDCGGKPLYRHVAAKLTEWGSAHIGECGYDICGAVVGATHPAQLAELRASNPNTFFLVPGYGAQGGGAEDTAAAFDKRGGGAIVNSSRGLMCAYKGKDDDKNFQKYTREAVIAMRDALNSVRFR